MSVFEPPSRLRSIVIDPHKRVNYTTGMVLGVDDFVQESTWHTESLRHALRDLVGYGTVRGLKVATKATGDGPEVVVRPGVAITPRGEVVRVPEEQCALLDQWLQSGGYASERDQRAHQDAVNQAVVVGSPVDGGTLDVYVVLDFAECTTDPRPIPGEPCRSEDDVLVDSRIKDGFSLSLQLRPPQQIEHQGAHDFACWLARVPCVDTSPVEGLEGFLDEIRALAKAGSPPGPPFMSAPTTLSIPRSEAETWRRAAWRLYVTELRADPSWLAADQTATGEPPSRERNAPTGVLLARLRIPVLQNALLSGSRWQVASGETVVVDDSERPFLVQADFIKEHLLCSACATHEGAPIGSTSSPTSPTVIAAGDVAVLASGTPEPTGVTVGTYGYLFAQEQGAGVVRVIFATTSTSGAAYVLQATPVQPAADTAADDCKVNVEGSAIPTATAGHLSFVLRVRRAGTFMSVAALRTLRLMIQITAYPAASA